MILRINELAKELGKSNRDILNYLSEKGIDNKVPMSNISAQEEGMIRTHFAPKKPEPPKQEDFEAWRRGYTRGAVDFDDFAAVSKALVQLAGGGGFINLLKQEVYAPFDGTVILVAQDRAPDYEVFDVAANRKDPQRYRKGESVRTLGTTVWVLSADKKYVGVFSQLGRSDATVGQRVTGGKTRIGECRDYKSRSFQLYRVYNPSQYFLNGSRGSQPIQLFPWADEDTTYSTAPQVWREPTRGW